MMNSLVFVIRNWLTYGKVDQGMLDILDCLAFGKGDYMKLAVGVVNHTRLLVVDCKYFGNVYCMFVREFALILMEFVLLQVDVLYLYHVTEMLN